MAAEFDWVQATGWLAAALTLSAYAMRTMLPLRMVAIGANVFFIVYSSLEGILPTLALHSILLPFNAYRLWEILRTTRQMRSLTADAKVFEWLSPYLRPVPLARDEYVFRKGDPTDCLYIMRSGKLRLEEIGVTLEGEQIFGEIAFFTNQRTRTVSARCLDDCQIMKVDEAAFMRLYNQHPAFGLYIVRLTASRLLDGLQRSPEVYLDPKVRMAILESARKEGV